MAFHSCQVRLDCVRIVYQTICGGYILETSILENGLFVYQTLWGGDLMKTDVLAQTLWSRSLCYISKREEGGARSGCPPGLSSVELIARPSTICSPEMPVRLSGELNRLSVCPALL